MLGWNFSGHNNRRQRPNWNQLMIFWRFKMRKALSCMSCHGLIPIRPFAIEKFHYWIFQKLCKNQELFEWLICAIYYINAAKTNTIYPTYIFCKYDLACLVWIPGIGIGIFFYVTDFYINRRRSMNRQRLCTDSKNSRNSMIGVILIFVLGDHQFLRCSIRQQCNQK